MKKSLLILSCVAISSVAYAQHDEAVFATDESFAAAGIVKDKTQMDGDKVFAEGESGSVALAYADSWGYGGISKTHKTVKVGDEIEVTLGNGAVGNTNPTWVSYESGEPQSAGAVFKIHSNWDGYMTVFTTISPNKQYVVLEGELAGNLAFTLGCSDGVNTIHYATPFYSETNVDADPIEIETYINWNDPDINKYFITAQKQSTNENGKLLWTDAEGNVVVTEDDKKPEGGAAVMEDIPGNHKPQFPYIVGGFDSNPGNMTGFMTFCVAADTDYYFSALGSKCTVGGYVYTTENPTVTFKEQLNDDGSVKYPEVVFPAMGYGADLTSVEGVAAVANEEAPVYNLMGVRVNSDAKGILIQNGKKFIRK